MSSDGGALLLQAVDQRIGLTRRLATCFVDHRNPRRCEHSLQRLFGLALGYEDLCDHDRLRERDRGPAARPAGGAFLPRLLRLLLLPPAVCDLRATPAVRAAATVQPGRGGRGRGRVAADRGADPAEGVDYVFGLAQNARRPGGGMFTLRQFAEQDGQSAPEPVPVDADMATRGDS